MIMVTSRKPDEKYFRVRLNLSRVFMTAIEKIEAETRERVMKLINSKTEYVARRDNLDLKNPADLVTAYSKICTEDPELYNLYRRVSSLPIGKISLTD